ncbi:MAG: hypothetical protein RLZZ387_1523 [Chloroflexota bacterium]
MVLEHDSVTVAPHVLISLISAAVCAVPGVARPGQVPRWRGGILTAKDAGFALRTDPGGVSVDCYLVALPDTNLLEMGAAVQASIGRVLSELVGVAVREVNVFIEDVAEPTTAGETVGHG